jgi:hypothetical protein
MIPLIILYSELKAYYGWSTNIKNAEDIRKLNVETAEQNTNKNNAYNTVITISTNTSGGDYVKQRELIRQLEGTGLSDQFKNTLENNFKAFYTTEKLQHGIQSLVLNPHMVNLILLITRPRAQRLLSNGIPLLLTMILISLNDMVRVVFISSTTQPKASLLGFAGTKQRLLQQQMNT